MTRHRIATAALAAAMLVAAVPSADAGPDRAPGFVLEDLPAGPLPKTAYYLAKQDLLVTAGGTRIHPGKGPIDILAQARPDVVFFHTSKPSASWRWTPQAITRLDSFDWYNVHFQEGTASARMVAMIDYSNSSIEVTTAKTGLRVAELADTWVDSIKAFDGSDVYFYPQSGGLMRWNYETDRVARVAVPSGRLLFDVGANVRVVQSGDDTDGWRVSAAPLLPGGDQPKWTVRNAALVSLSPNGRLLAPRLPALEGEPWSRSAIDLRSVRTGRIVASFQPKDLETYRPRWEDNRHFLPKLYSKQRSAYVRMGSNGILERSGPVAARDSSAIVVDVQYGSRG